jgi:hypothetical protein
MKYVSKNLGAIGIGTMITLVGGVAVAVFTAVTYVQSYVGTAIEPVNAQITTLQTESNLHDEQTAVIGANLLLICQSNPLTVNKCKDLPSK